MSSSNGLPGLRLAIGFGNGSAMIVGDGSSVAIGIGFGPALIGRATGLLAVLLFAF